MRSGETEGQARGGCTEFALVNIESEGRELSRTTHCESPNPYATQYAGTEPYASPYLSEFSGVTSAKCNRLGVNRNIVRELSSQATEAPKRITFEESRRILTSEVAYTVFPVVLR